MVFSTDLSAPLRICLVIIYKKLFTTDNHIKTCQPTFSLHASMQRIFSSTTSRKLHPNLTRSIFATFHPPRPTYGGKFFVTCLPGIGIGPEVIISVKTVFQALGVPVDFQTIAVDLKGDEESDLHFIESSIKGHQIALSGTLSFHTNVHFDLKVRQLLHMHTFVARIISEPTIPGKFKDVDVIIVRQNTMGEFTMMEHSPTKGVVTYLKVMERELLEKLLHYAFQYAIFEKRKTVTIIHKANIMKLTDGMLLRIGREISKQYPQVKMNDMIVDNACMQIVKKPQQFDVLVTTNLYGMLLMKILMGMTNSPGLTPGINIGNNTLIFEPASRTVGRALVGKNLANPIAMMRSAKEMIKFIGFKNQAELLNDAIQDTIFKKKIRTPDIGGTHTTQDITNSLVEYVNKNKIAGLHFLK